MYERFTEEWAVKKFYPRVKMVKGGCVEWQGSVDTCGYGNVTCIDQTFKTHRVAYFLAHGPIPHGLHVCHSCDNPRCVNPHHLFLGTRSDNMRDAVRKGRKPGPRGEKAPKAKLTEKDVREIVRIRAEGTTTSRELAKRFGVTPTAVSSIFTGKTWSHLWPDGKPGVSPQTVGWVLGPRRKQVT